MQRIISFGKVDATGNGIKDNAIEVEIELKQEDNKESLSICGTVWKRGKRDCIMGGQCLDDIKKLIPHNKRFEKVYKWWEAYHLNDMNAGTKEQTQAINKAIQEGILQGYDYDKVCDYLKSINLYEVEYQGKPYKYGHGWLYEPIPEEDLKEIKVFLWDRTKYNN